MSFTNSVTMRTKTKMKLIKFELFLRFLVTVGNNGIFQGKNLENLRKTIKVNLHFWRLSEWYTFAKKNLPLVYTVLQLVERLPWEEMGKRRKISKTFVAWQIFFKVSAWYRCDMFLQLKVCFSAAVLHRATKLKSAFPSNSVFWNTTKIYAE